jgi:hypothetical protein
MPGAVPRPGATGAQAGLTWLPTCDDAPDHAPPRRRRGTRRLLLRLPRSIPSGGGGPAPVGRRGRPAVTRMTAGTPFGPGPGRETTLPRLTPGQPRGLPAPETTTTQRSMGGSRTERPRRNRHDQPERGSLTTAPPPAPSHGSTTCVGGTARRPGRSRVDVTTFQLGSVPVVAVAHVHRRRGRRPRGGRAGRGRRPSRRGRSTGGARPRWQGDRRPRAAGRRPRWDGDRRARAAVIVATPMPGTPAARGHQRQTDHGCGREHAQTRVARTDVHSVPPP